MTLPLLLSLKQSCLYLLIVMSQPEASLAGALTDALRRRGKIEGRRNQRPTVSARALWSSSGAGRDVVQIVDAMGETIEVSSQLFEGEGEHEGAGRAI
jgi:hypothetical protein